MASPKGGLILALLLLLLGGGEFNRIYNDGQVLKIRSSPPAEGTLVFLGDGFPEKGMHHFYDDHTPISVIQMTIPGVPIELNKDRSMSTPLSSGESLELFSANGKEHVIKRAWAPSEVRMAFFIPLHPDRMSLRDWEALPGIGPRLAIRIEENRQKNGDFGCLENLKRVKGIGNGLVQRLKNFF